ncbi:MAG: hypothetical protein ACTTIM_05670, partial [Campylobacter sp.]
MMPVTFFTNQNVGYDNEGTGGGMTFQKNKDINNGYDIMTIDGKKWLTPGIYATQAGSSEPKRLQGYEAGAIGLYTKNVNNNMFGSQTSTSAKFGVSNKGGQGEQSLLTYMIFSTDIYKPNICYEDHVYNSEGVKDKFPAIKGETIRTVVKFKNKPRNGDKGETAVGLLAKFIMDSNNTYNSNTLILNNKVDSKFDLPKYNDKLQEALKNPNSNNDFAFLKDNQKDAYKDFERKIPFENGIYKDKMLNLVASKQINKTEYKREVDKDGKVTIKPFEVTYNTTEVTVPIGKDAGKDSKLVGGELKVGESVYLEYNSTLGDRYVPNVFTLSFAQVVNGERIEYNYSSNELDKCEGDTGDAEINILPLNGLRVVNQNVTQEQVDNAIDSKTGKVKDLNDNLYTQIGGKKFNAALIYTPDMSNSVTLDKYGNVIMYDPLGRPLPPISYEEYLQKIKTTKFDSYGIVYLSLIPKEELNDKKCKDLIIGAYKNDKPIKGSHTVPFYYEKAPKEVTVGAKITNP